MMTWDFRLLDVTDENGGEPYLMLVEAHYNDEGVPVGYCDPCTGSEDLEGITEVLQWHSLALSKPVLNKSAFVGVFEEKQ